MTSHIRTLLGGVAALGVEAAWPEHLKRGWQRRALTWEGQDPRERQVAW